MFQQLSQAIVIFREEERHSRRGACVLAATLGIWAFGTPRGLGQDQAPGAQAPLRPAIEEIVVTAERREERLRDVPISMSVLNSEFLHQQSIIDFQDLTRYVPNLRFSGSTQRTEPQIRGFGTPGDIIQPRSFEQAVGLLIDGIPYSRYAYYQAGLLDLDRLEVLRGPQGTLMGKNASVGSLNLSTKDPTDEYTGHVDVQLGELDRRRFEAAIGGPVRPGLLNFRVAGLSDEQDGFIRNTTATVDPSARKRNAARDTGAVRVKVDFPDLLGANLGLSYERWDINYFGKNLELRRVSDNVRPFFIRYDPNTDFKPDNFVGSVDTENPVRVDIETFVAHASYDLGGWGLETHAGWTSLESFTTGDSDYTPSATTNSTFTERTPQLTVESLLHSPALPGFFGLGSVLGFPLGSTEFTMGVLYQRQRLDPIRNRVRVSTEHVAEMILFDETGFAPPPPPGSDAGEEPTPRNETLDQQFWQTTNVIAGFGQANWHFLDPWTLLYGMRVQYESKDARWDNHVSDNAVALRAGAFKTFTLKRDLSNVEFAPKVGLKYRWTDDFQLFTTWSRGFRTGGFNSSLANADNPEQVEFKSESVASWEVGAKTEFLDGTAGLDLTLYNMTLKDFQLSTNLPTGVFSIPAVQNAGEVRARGIEADGTWLPTDWLTFRGAMAFNDTELLKFPFGVCEADRPNSDGDKDPRCDLSGGPLQNAPKWTMTMTPQIIYPLSLLPGLQRRAPVLDGIELRGGLSVEYVDTHFLRESLDPRTRQGSFFRLNANIGLASPGSGWDLRFTVDNLTDESVSTFVTIPVVNTVRDTFFQFPDPPRLVFGSLRWSF